MGHNIAHTVCARGKRVAIVLKNGQVVTGKFVRRAKNNRWVEVEHTLPEPCRANVILRVQRAEIQSFSTLKGPLDPKRLGLKGAKK